MVLDEVSLTVKTEKPRKLYIKSYALLSYIAYKVINLPENLVFIRSAPRFNFHLCHL